MDDILGSNFSCSTNHYHTDEVKILAITRLVCLHLGLPGYEVSVSLVSKEEIQTLNREHRNKDKPTDVLSFPQEDFGAPLPLIEDPSPQITSHATQSPPHTLGDVIICLDIAKQNATDIGQSLDREVAFLLVHGILHLGGYDHEQAADEVVMLDAQKRLMSWLDSNSGEPLWNECVLPPQARAYEIAKGSTPC